MKLATKKYILLTVLMAVANWAMAQNGSGKGSNWFIYILLAVAVLLFFVIVIQVSDNMLAIEAKRVGVSEPGSSFSIFPTSRELVPRRKPDYAMDDQVISTRRGYDILLEGEPKSKSVLDASVTTYAILPPNFIGLSPIPKVTVEVGDNVKAGGHTLLR